MQCHTSYIAIKLHFPHTRLAYDLIAWQELLFDHYSPFFSPLFTPIHLYSPLFTPYSLLFMLSHPCLSLFIPYSPLFTPIHSYSLLFTPIHFSPPFHSHPTTHQVSCRPHPYKHTLPPHTFNTTERFTCSGAESLNLAYLLQFRVIFKALCSSWCVYVVRGMLFLLCVFVWRLYIQTLSPWVLEIVACLSAWLRKALVACTSTTTHHHTTTHHPRPLTGKNRVKMWD